jgi:uncharacterized protein YbaR (Trm112 family)
MRASLVDILACPDCRAGLQLIEGTGVHSELEAGTLGCPGCGTSFPVRGEIPRLLPKAIRDEAADAESQRSTASHFAKEFTALAEDDSDMFPFELLEFYFYSRTGLDERLRKASLDVLSPQTLSRETWTYCPDRSSLAGKVVPGVSG